MKNIFIEELIKARKKNKNILLVVNDLGYGMVEPFVSQFPKSIYNAGVSEQSMMGYAAGLAACGNHVFVYSIGNFNTFRCAEQIRNDIDYHKLSVTIVSAGAGVGYGSLGYTHHAIQDYSLIRSFPNMTIASPGDVMELRSCMDFLVNNPQPSYLRLEKSSQFKIHSRKPKVYPGKWLKVFENRKTDKKREIYLSTGSVLEFIQNSIKKGTFKEKSLYTVPMWGMKSKKFQSKKIKKFKKIHVIEDHLNDGGFQSWLSESNVDSKIVSKSLSSKVIEKVGSKSYLMKFLK